MSRMLLAHQFAQAVHSQRARACVTGRKAVGISHACASIAAPARPAAVVSFQESLSLLMNNRFTCVLHHRIFSVKSTELVVSSKRNKFFSAHPTYQEKPLYCKYVESNYHPTIYFNFSNLISSLVPLRLFLAPCLCLWSCRSLTISVVRLFTLLGRDSHHFSTIFLLFR